MQVSVAYFDPETGAISAAFRGREQAIPAGQAYVAVPPGVVIDDVRAWRVDLETRQLVRVGREPERDEVNRERDRRIAAGFDFAGKVIQFRPEDKDRITGLGALAGFAISQGAQPGDFNWHDPDDDPMGWIAADNSVLMLDAQTAFAMARTAARHEKQHVFAAMKIKNASPRPMDYDADHHWPPRPAL